MNGSETVFSLIALGILLVGNLIGLVWSAAKMSATVNHLSDKMSDVSGDLADVSGNQVEIVRELSSLQARMKIIESRELSR